MLQVVFVLGSRALLTDLPEAWTATGVKGIRLCCCLVLQRHRLN